MSDIHDQIQEAKRELKMRKNVYPCWVELGKLKPYIAQKRIETMEAIIDTLEDYERRTRAVKQQSLFG